MSTPQLATFKCLQSKMNLRGLEAALAQMQHELPFEVSYIVNDSLIRTDKLVKQAIPSDHAADEATVANAIDGALSAKFEWEAMPWNDRAAIFLCTAELVSGKYCYKLVAATMLGQGKNTWQADIDAVELSDFLCFGVKYVEELHAQQPPKNAVGSWNRIEYHALEGFVLAVSPFNFTAIGGNLPDVPAIVGNTVVWKPSPAATYSNYLIYQILAEAGVPPGVIRFIPGPPPEVVAQAISHPNFTVLHFTGSTFIFKKLWKDIATNLDNYKGHPRIIGETGGKNFHVIHKSAEIRNAYQGQKCSALPRLYVSSSLWSSGFKDLLLSEVAKIKIRSPSDFSNFIGPVIGRPAHDKIIGFIQKAKDAGGEVLIGGTGDDSKGYFIQPTVILTKDPESVTMKEEIFGPVYVYDDTNYEQTLELIENTSLYALTGSIFATERRALLTAKNKLHNTAGNVYYNEKCTGAVVGRASGTNDKARSISIFYRFISVRSIKENFVGLEDFQYPSNLI
ncbi:Aldehyde/histidinol dehydrogenase [Suillus discolor]|uniref:L-glutamate gamma-semialdehyde dehydrogenase n=1 Tax=Suillus discolor TaxID=1912936 RepID=A0A9P7FGL0_9AGAM|nr:Aldehyde/histidinol dehydrogenase [Suillus discolor]KAG2115898.1 Aldehyde/histidinol dehydrogenase [Suillus discolor]